MGYVSEFWFGQSCYGSGFIRVIVGRPLVFGSGLSVLGLAGVQCEGLNSEKVEGSRFSVLGFRIA